jgi:hypothetical protein
MNPLSSLITAMLQHQLGVTISATATDEEKARVTDLERIVMEGGIAAFLESSDPATSEKFVTWMESHQSDPDLITNVFTTFPTLFAAVHREMVETIEATKRTTSTQ